MAHIYSTVWCPHQWEFTLQWKLKKMMTKRTFLLLSSSSPLSKKRFFFVSKTQTMWQAPKKWVKQMDEYQLNQEVLKCNRICRLFWSFFLFVCDNRLKMSRFPFLFTYHHKKTVLAANCEFFLVPLLSVFVSDSEKSALSTARLQFWGQMENKVKDHLPSEKRCSKLFNQNSVTIEI